MHTQAHAHDIADTLQVIAERMHAEARAIESIVSYLRTHGHTEANEDNEERDNK